MREFEIIYSLRLWRNLFCLFSVGSNSQKVSFDGNISSGCSIWLEFWQNIVCWHLKLKLNKDILMNFKLRHHIIILFLRFFFMDDEILILNLVESIKLQYATTDHLAPVYQGKGEYVCRSWVIFKFHIYRMGKNCRHISVPSFVDMQCRSFCVLL